MGRRSRYRVLDIDRLLESVAIDRPADLRAIYSEGIEEQLRRRKLDRNPEWTEALAVGDRKFVEHVASDFNRRNRFNYAEVPGSNEAWSVREIQSAYVPISGPKPAPKQQ